MSLTQTFTGRCNYYVDVATNADSLILAVEYQVEGFPVRALLDTGARWGIFPADLAHALGYDAATNGAPAHIRTRLGDFEGRLLRIPVYIPAAEGDGLDIELTWFVSAEWPGPPVLGWSGCLERLRIAVDPTPGEDCFYFGAVS